MGIVDVALSQEGTTEATGNNDVKYNDWYYGRHVSGGSYPWCAVFVSWCANQAGCLNAIGGKTASVSTLYTYFKNKGLFQPKGNGYRPKAGDILIQKSGGASHTGIVYASDASKFYTIEGNTSNGVYKRSYSYSDSKLTGFGTPNYDGSAMTGETPIIDDYNNTGTGSASGSSMGVGNYDYTAYTVKAGDTIESIAAKYNCTVAMLIFINNLDSTSLKAGQVLQVPTSTASSSDATSGVLSIETKHTSGVIVSHPVIDVEFYGEYGKLASVGVKDFTQDKDVEKDVISVNTVRNMGQDCPTFSLRLVWRHEWYSKLSSNDLVIIKMQRPPEVKQSVFFGLVDDIRKVTDFASGNPQRAVQVTGRGFCKAFVNFDVGLIQGWSIDTGTGFFGELTSIQGTNSEEAIRLVLKSYVNSEVIKYRFGTGETSFKSYFTYDSNARDMENLVSYESYTSYNGSLWNFIKELGNAPFDETYWEVLNNKPTLKHRRTPFNKADWIALPYTVIKDLDIVSDNTGRTDLETYTLFSVKNPIMDDMLDGGTIYPPLWYSAFYPKYGISQLEVSSPYMDYMTDSVVRSFHEDLFNFNIKNNVFSNGTLVVKGKAEYKVGQRVIIESENMEYYVESVTHNFNAYGNWTTSLGVTRGIEPAKRFTAPWGCAEEFSTAAMNAIVSQAGGGTIDWSNIDSYAPAGSTGDYTGGTYNYPSSYVSDGGTPSENETKIVEILKSWGLNTAAIAAVLGNINAESGFKTDVWGDNHTSLGLCQWHNGRCTNLQNYCRTHGYSVTSVEGQMAFLKSELQSGYKSTWNKLTSVSNTAQGAYDAAYFWCVHFEVPANKYQKAQERGNTARYTYFPRYS